MIGYCRTSLLLMVFCVAVSAQLSSDYVIMVAPIGVVSADQEVTVEWSGSVRVPPPMDQSFRSPDSGIIFFDRNPGGSDLNNYRYRVEKALADYDNYHVSGSPPRRGIRFRPEDQAGMNTGVFYCVVAWPMKSDTLYSNEFQIMVDSPNPVNWRAPSGSISNLTPLFRWEANQGVPYYHVILSDEEIRVDDSSGEININGVSIVWQAITANNQIAYGSPDPSGTITANPPPLSPGQRYTWLVMNNYGNHPAFSSPKVKLPPGEFMVTGEPLKKPVNVYPIDEWDFTSTDNETISFKWTNLDTLANTYQIFVYMSADSLVEGLSEGINAKIAVWEKTVSASRNTDTMSVEVNAASILTSNSYSWRVIAIDETGAGRAGAISDFSYYAPSGTLNVFTRELLVVSDGEQQDTVISSVGLVEITMEVLEGPMEAPLLFYTDNAGNLVRSRPAGTYRLTASKNGYENVSRTVELEDGSRTFDTLYLIRSPSSIFGRVVDETDRGVDLATLRAVSQRGDTVCARSDSRGNFIINCYGDDWWVSALKPGFIKSVAKRVTIGDGQNHNLGKITIQTNRLSLSGRVVNDNGNGVIGSRVRLFRNDELVDLISSTPQDGSFSFSVEPGKYTVNADKAGFSSQVREVTLSESRAVTITLRPGASIVTGKIIGKSWSRRQQEYVHAPIRGASVKFVSMSRPTDTVAVQSDATYGTFSTGLEGNVDYEVIVSAAGFTEKRDTKIISALPFITHNHQDTLVRKAMISGTVALSSTGNFVGGVNVSLYDSVGGVTFAQATSGTDGYFEIRGIPDGEYLISAGKSGLFLESVDPQGAVTVEDGRAIGDSFELLMDTGEKVIKWVIEEYEGSGFVRIRSPFARSISFDDSLSGAGAGTYIFSVDAQEDSVLGLSLGRIVVPQDVQRYVDTVVLDVTHTASDTLSIQNGRLDVKLKSVNMLDSAEIFYRSRGGNINYQSQRISRADSEYAFTVSPQRDGTELFYYFRAYRGNDIYGHDREVFSSYVKTDTSRLSRYEIAPFSDEIAVLPSDHTIRISLKGYYGSAFSPAKNLKNSAISWKLRNAQGNTLSPSRGSEVTVKTSDEKSNDTVWLVVTIDTSDVKLASGLSATDSVGFVTTGFNVNRLEVARTDNRSPNPITTSPIDRAEFRAKGYDTRGNRVEVNPAWSVIPDGAGVIDNSGVFRPSGDFVGYVRIVATSGSVSAEYNPYNAEEKVFDAGLNVRFVLGQQSRVADTRRGCKINFPRGVIGSTETGLIEVTTPDLGNQIRRGSGNLRMVDSIGYDIKQLESITFKDSIELVLSIPDSYREDAAAGKRKFWIARWDRDSLQWNTLENSVVSAQGKSISAKLAEFSRFAVLSESRELSGGLKISPNPFSPFIRPVNEHGLSAQFGTSIRYMVDAPEAVVPSVRISIHNNMGQRVWAVRHMNVAAGEHALWWDGRTTSKEEVIRGGEGVGGIAQGPMLRNGRYFVVLTIEDTKGKTVQYVKHVVLMK